MPFPYQEHDGIIIMKILWRHDNERVVERACTTAYHTSRHGSIPFMLMFGQFDHIDTELQTTQPVNGVRIKVLGKQNCW